MTKPLTCLANIWGCNGECISKDRNWPLWGITGLLQMPAWVCPLINGNIPELFCYHSGVWDLSSVSTGDVYRIEMKVMVWVRESYRSVAFEFAVNYPFSLSIYIMLYLSLAFFFKLVEKHEKHVRMIFNSMHVKDM